MLETPVHGWSKITIGDWEDRCSYLNDVPYRLLEAVDYTNRTYKPSSVRFDAEGWEYIIVFDVFATHIITYDFNGDWKYNTVEVSVKSIIKDLIVDIRKDLNAWSEWGFNMTEDEIDERRKDLAVWCDVIEKRLQKVLDK